MSNVPQPAPGSGRPATTGQPAPQGGGTAPPRRSSLWWLVPLIILVLGGGAAGYAYYIWSSVGTINFPRELRAILISSAGLEEGLKDENGDLLADAPPEGEQKNPDVLVLSVLEQGDRAKKTWDGEFIPYLEKKLQEASPKIKVKRLDLSPAGTGVIESMKKGELHVAALSTGAVPLAVNRAGFIPICMPARDEKSFGYEMEILVRPESEIKALADLRGKKIWLGSMSSLSSFKAPLMVLWKEQKMLPGRHYEFLITEGQTKSIENLLKGETEKDYAVAVANDLLAREIKNRSREEKWKDIYKKENYRSIFKSPTYPPVTFGHVYNLKPELAKKIKEAFLSFPWEQGGKESGVKKEFGPAGATRFIAVDYKKHFAPVIEMDKALLELVEQGK